MEKQISSEPEHESHVLKAFKLKETQRINANDRLFFDEKRWLSKKIRQKQLSPQEIEAFARALFISIKPFLLSEKVDSHNEETNREHLEQ
jgi:hypothetical protein